MPLPASKLIRRIHLYLALFLTPWMLIYGLSGLVLNHGATVRSFYGPTYGQFEKIGEQPYPGTSSADADPRLIGAQILEHLGMPGTFHVQGQASAPRLTIVRNAPFEATRVTYVRAENRLLLERQVFSAPIFLNRAHFRHGYEHAFFSAKVWAFVVDLSVVGMFFWALSGLWMWWEMRPTRLTGALVALGGCGLFAVLLFTL